MINRFFCCLAQHLRAKTTYSYYSTAQIQSSPSLFCDFVRVFEQESEPDSRGSNGDSFLLRHSATVIDFYPSSRIQHRGSMFSRIHRVANTRFSSTGVARLVSSHASTVSNRNGLSEILRKSGPRRSVPSLLQEMVDSGHAVTLSELRLISKRLIRSNRHDLALQV